MAQELTVEQAQEIADTIVYRRATFMDEDMATSVMVALLNYGDGDVRVECVAGEWSGMKRDLPMGPGLPTCPNGHPMFEVSPGSCLAVQERKR